MGKSTISMAIVNSKLLNLKNTNHVAGWPTSLKNIKVSWGYGTIPNMWENKKCSKPPTRIKMELET